jgi:hypothetical protein
MEPAGDAAPPAAAEIHDAVGAAVGWAVGCEPRPPALRPPGAGEQEAFLAQVTRQRVGALLYAAGWGQAAGAPAELQAALELHARRTVAAALYTVAVQRELVSALEDAGVAVLVLKGPALSVLAHGDPGRRSVGDIDLLVRPGQAAEAVAALEAGGFDPTRLSVQEEGWREALPAVLAATHRYPLLKDVTLQRGKLSVELHWRLFANRHLLAVDDAWLGAPRRVGVAGAGTPVLPLAALWRYLCAHGTEHRWERMMWLCDIVALVRRHPQLASPDSLRAAATDGLAPSVACAVLVAEHVLGRFVSEDARRWACAVPGTGVLVAEALDGIGRATPLRERIPAREMPRFLRAHLAACTDRRYRREEIRRMLLLAAADPTEPDPGLAVLARGPARWAARVVRRPAATP